MSPRSAWSVGLEEDEVVQGEEALPSWSPEKGYYKPNQEEAHKEGPRRADP
jgi:hypothetical protein